MKVEKVATPSHAPRSYSPRSTFRPAFTLIELVVVIAIIAILAALLLPALSRARSAAETTVCKSNLHQFAVALNTYTVDSGAYPPGAWQQPLQPYIGKWPSTPNFADPGGFPAEIKWVHGTWACPSYNRMPGVFIPMGPTVLRYGAYGYNDVGVSSVQYSSGRLVVLGLSGDYFIAHADGTISAGSSRVVKQAEVIAPSQMIAFADADIAHGGYNDPVPPNGWFQVAAGDPRLYCWDPFAWLSDPSTGLWRFLGGSRQPPGEVDYLKAYSRLVQKRHRGRWNTTFCDAHVENLRPQQLHSSSSPPDPYNDDLLKRWNLDNLPHREMLDSLNAPP